MIPHLQVKVTLLPTCHGGRKSHVVSGYRPQFYYGGDDWDASYTYDVEKVNPGDSVTALLSFVSPDIHKEHVYKGMPFLVREGNKVVGYGVVTEVFDTNGAVDNLKTTP